MKKRLEIVVNIWKIFKNNKILAFLRLVLNSNEKYFYLFWKNKKSKKNKKGKLFIWKNNNFNSEIYLLTLKFWKLFYFSHSLLLHLWNIN